MVEFECQLVSRMVRDAIVHRIAHYNSAIKLNKSLFRL